MRQQTLAPKKLVPYLKEMYLELTTQRFKASQVQDQRQIATKGRNIWIRESKNPKWYSDLLQKYPRNRSHTRWKWKKKAKRGLVIKDSKIKRGHIENYLNQLISESPCYSKYAPDLIQIAKDRQEKNLKPVSEAEFLFWEVHRILLEDDEIIKQIEKTPQDLWVDIADFYQKNSRFPDWLAGKVPF